MSTTTALPAESIEVQENISYFGNIETYNWLIKNKFDSDLLIPVFNSKLVGR